MGVLCGGPQGGWVLGCDFGGVASSSTGLVGFSLYLMALLIFANHQLLNQDFKMWGFFPLLLGTYLDCEIKIIDTLLPCRELSLKE